MTPDGMASFSGATGESCFLQSLLQLPELLWQRRNLSLFFNNIGLTLEHVINIALAALLKTSSIRLMLCA